MRIPRIYSAQPLAPNRALELDENSSRHVARVLRMQAGRELVLFDGRGGEYSAIIEEVGKKRVTVKVGDHQPVERESSLPIHLGIGVSRGERMDWVLQKATELGVSQITPLFTERTEVKLSGSRLEKKQQHWQQVLIAACEQCQRNTLPLINPPMNIVNWLTEVDAEAKLVLHHRTQQSLDQMSRPASVALVIGPEGGLSNTEIDHAMKQEFAPLALGPRVLRTETAPLAAISVMQYLWGDLC